MAKYNPTISSDNWNFYFRRGKIEKKGVIKILNSTEVRNLLEDVANQLIVGNKRYVHIKRIKGRVGIRGYGLDRSGVGIYPNQNAGIHERHMKNVLLQIARKKVRKHNATARLKRQNPTAPKASRTVRGRK